VEDGLDAAELRLDVLEATDSTTNSRLDDLELEVYLSSIRNPSLVLSTTPQVVACNTCQGSLNISVNPDGSITYPYSGRYVVSWLANVAVTVATTVHFWVEKWDDVLSEWETIPFSGIIRDFPTTNEVEFSVTYLRIVAAGDTYRIMASKVAAGSASLVTSTLPNGVVMPSFRFDIRN
jgi:hypothetical protein